MHNTCSVYKLHCQCLKRSLILNIPDVKKHLPKPDVICLNLMKQKTPGLEKMLINNITPISITFPIF